MKNLFTLIAIMLIGILAFAQSTTTRTLSVMNSGVYKSFNATYADTIGSQDTIVYIVRVKHAEKAEIAIQQLGTVVASDTTVSLTMYESMDGDNYTQLIYNNSGSQANYAALTLAKGALNQSIYPDVAGCYLRGRYLKLVYIAPEQTGFKKVLYGTIKTNHY